MKKIILLLLNIVFLFSCSAQNGNYQISIYDNPKYSADIASHKENLKKLDNIKIFSILHNKLLSSMNDKQKDYFNSRLDYELLFMAKGDIFLNNANDYAFVVYDRKNIRISIVVFNEMTNKYLELYREIKIENGLELSDCNYSSFRTLDYQIADEINYQEEYLIKNPQKLLESPLIKITNIGNDKDFVLNSGCLSKKEVKENLLNSICISTSSVYNNWECMKYDKSRNIFVIFYSQAFAD